MSPARGRPRKQPGIGVPARDERDELDADAPDDEADASLRAAAERVNAAVSGIADRTQRAVRLTQLLNSPDSPGAVIVAASRVLESMERAERGDATQAAGPPLPSTRAEQVVRLVHVLATAAPDVREEALELLARRCKSQAARIREMAPVLVANLVLPTQTAPSAPEPSR